MLLLLLLRPLDGAKHSYVKLKALKASQHCCVHVCKGTSSNFVAFEADRFVLQHSEDSLQITLSTSSFQSLFDTPHG